MAINLLGSFPGFIQYMLDRSMRVGSRVAGVDKGEKAADGRIFGNYSQDGTVPPHTSTPRLGLSRETLRLTNKGEERPHM